MSKFKYKHSSTEYQKTVAYADLKDMYMFLRRDYQGGYRVYTKISAAFAIDSRSGKDAIFLPHERVVPLYPSITDGV